MDEMKKLGNKVILITSENIKEKNWPWHAIDEVFYMQEVEPSVWNLDPVSYTHLDVYKRQKEMRLNRRRQSICFSVNFLE